MRSFFKSILSLLLTLLALLFVFPAVISAEESGKGGENITWTLSDTGVLTFTGSGTLSSSVGSKLKPNIRIINIENGITAVDSSSFGTSSDYYGLSSIVIPESVKSFTGSFEAPVGRTVINDIFTWCRIDFERDVSNPIVISKNLYIGNEPVNDLVIPDNVTVIKQYAFRYCESLKSVVIPENVNKIGYVAFERCKFLSEVTFLGDVESIYYNAFNNCSDSLTFNCTSDAENVIRFAKEHGITCNITNIEPTVSYAQDKVSVTQVNRIKSISYARGRYTTTLIYNAKDCVTIQKAEIDENALNGEYSFTLPLPGEYTVLVKTVDGAYSYHRINAVECEHFFAEYISNNDADCINNETMTASCVYCGMSDTVTVENTATGHDFKYYSFDDNYTCTEDGTESAYCMRCNTVDIRVVPDTAAHRFGNYKYNYDQTCTRNGTSTRVCQLCDAEETIEVPDSAAHSYITFVYNNDATCTEDGTETAKCEFCDLTYTRTKSGTMAHIYGEYSYDNNATCTENGTKSRYCIFCERRSFVTVTDSALGHLYINYISNNDATCQSNGTRTARCERCDSVNTELDADSKLDHNYTVNKYNNDATCTSDGTVTSYCGMCNHCIKRTAEDTALGHSFIAFAYDNNATCLSDGTMTAVCDRCDEKRTVSAIGSALGHSFIYYIYNEDATCFENGTQTARCERCDATDTVMAENTMLAHIPGELTLVREADYDNDGLKTVSCTVCQTVLESEIIPMLIYKAFPDVWKGDWYAEGVEYCFKKGIIIGTDKGTFDPYGALTREQLVVMLARISGEDISVYHENPFVDVADDAWYTAAILWAYGKGYICGTGNGRFGTGCEMTREEYAVVLYRYAASDTRISTLSSFEDAALVSDWAVDAMGWAVESALIGSVSRTANILSPQMTLTRGQAAKVFMSFHLINEEV